MENNEDKLSSYIDNLNKERKPKQHGGEIETDEMEELLATIRKVRSLKEPTMPPSGYSKRLAANINRKLNPKRKWFYGAATAVASIALIFILNINSSSNKNNIVYAMEQAYKGIKAYHGVLEVTETNAEGKSLTQSKIEVWADKEGHYYVKGIEGTQKDLITANDGEKKWQIQPQEKEVDVFAPFPDPYSFTFDIGKEIDDVKNAVQIKAIGEDSIAGRAASIIEVTPKGGSSYKLWVDKETKMPLQKQTAMEYSLQYTVHYANINFTDAIPKNLLTYNLPLGFREVSSNTDQVVSTLGEAAKLAGFTPKAVLNLSSSYSERGIAVINNSKAVKIIYTSQNNFKNISVLQKKTSGELKPVSTAILGKVNNCVAEVQSPIRAETGVLQGAGAYAGITGLTSVRWQNNGIEYAVVGNVSLNELTTFVKALTNETVELIPVNDQAADRPKVEVTVDLKSEEGDQKNADAGHSPWKLDPVFVSQVFVSLKISPQGIVGDYPVKYEDLKVVRNNGKEAVVEVSGNNTPIRKVYLKKLIRQDSTGIWTVVGYDPAS